MAQKFGLLPGKDSREERIAKSLEVTHTDLVPGQDALDKLLCEKWEQIEKTAPIVDIINKIETTDTHVPKVDATKLLLDGLNEYVDGYESSVSTCRTSARDREPAAESAVDDPGRGRYDPEKQSTTNRVDEIKTLRDDLKLAVENFSDDDTVAIDENIAKIKSVLGATESNSNHQAQSVVTFSEDWIRSAVDEIDKEPIGVKENITDVVREKQKKSSEVSKRGTHMDHATAYKDSAAKYLKHLPPAEKKKERIPKLKFTDVSGVVTVIREKVKRQQYNHGQIKILQRAICMSDEFSRAKSFEDQVSLFRKFEERGWSITPRDMDIFFQEGKFKRGDATVISTFVKAEHDLKNWKVLLEKKPNITFKMDENVKLFFEMDTHIEGARTLTAADGTIKQFPKRIWQTARYSTKIHGPMLDMALQSNRLRVIIDSILLSKGNAKTIDGCYDEESLGTADPAERKGKDPDEEDDYLSPGIVDASSQQTYYSQLTDSQLTDSEESPYGTAPGVEDDNGSRYGGKKSISQKRGGFIKGILKNMSTCGCNKKTRRRNGKKFTVRKRKGKGKGKGHGKGKKMGGKRTIRKKLKTGGVKDRRVRFTVKN
jgi:hypothetical protein